MERETVLWMAESLWRISQTKQSGGAELHLSTLCSHRQPGLPVPLLLSSDTLLFSPLWTPSLLWKSTRGWFEFWVHVYTNTVCVQTFTYKFINDHPFPYTHQMPDKFFSVTHVEKCHQTLAPKCHLDRVLQCSKGMLVQVQPHIISWTHSSSVSKSMCRGCK